MSSKILILFLITASFAWGQEPSHFFLGEEELAGVHVYDLKQDKSETYWLATNAGLIKYDGYSFNYLTNGEMTSNSLFNICFDENDNVYCNNLSGQIFRTSNDSLELYYQIPDSLMNREITLNFDEEGDLIVITKRLFYVDDNRNAHFLDNNEISGFLGGVLINPFKTLTEDNVEHPQYGLYVFDYGKQDVYCLKNKELSFITHIPGKIKPGFFNYENELLIIDINSGSPVYFNQEQKENLVEVQTILDRNIFYDGTYFWLVQFTGGVKVTEDPANKEIQAPIVFSNHIISAFFVDKEGNTLLGTFGDGLIVIPNMSSTLYHLPDINDRPTRITSAGENGLLIGTQKGKVYSFYDAKGLDYYGNISSKFVERIIYFPVTNQFLVDDYAVHLLDLNDGSMTNLSVGALKSACQKDDTTYYLASNQGVRMVDSRSGEITLIDGLRTRTNAVGYNANSNTIYAGTASGLIYGSEGNFNLFEIDDEPLLSTFILSESNRIFICTANNGVLVFENDKHIQSWNNTNGFPDNSIKKILPYKNKFVVKSSKGIFLCNDEGQDIQWIKIAEGMTVRESSDIAVHTNYLYLTHAKGIQKINLEKIGDDLSTPEVNLAKVYVNDMLNSNFKSGYELSPDENKLSFDLSVRTLRYRDELQYKYRLSNIDDEWQYNSYSDNAIEYKSLPAGEYIFEYGLALRGKESEVKSIKFRISQVFWRSNWFWAGLILLVLLSSYLVYKAQLKRQRLKSKQEKELISSKLTAIQSQMNPHFIFNSLNSIQDLVLNQQGENAYNYISKFAFLVRKVLQYSEVEFIRLDDELKVLEVYLELEQLRFDDDFYFSFEMDLDEEVEIPPMIIQPFVENAIKHGLLHKSGDKYLKIRFKLDEKLLYCQIEDNGIGRSKSKEINLRKNRNYESFSTSSIQNRFEILKNIHGGELGLEYEDLYENEEAVGTVVRLQIPIKRSH